LFEAPTLTDDADVRQTTREAASGNGYREFVQLQVILLFAFLLLGVALQASRTSESLRDSLWRVHFWTLAPLLVFVTFSTIQLDRKLTLALTSAIVASWLVLGAGLLYGVLVTREPDERAALGLAAGFGNTGFVGYPLAQLAYGHPGLALAVLYDRLAFLIPPLTISTTLARLFGRREAGPRRRLRFRVLVANPPFLALVAALALRAAGAHLPLLEEGMSLAGATIGPLGFLLLGLSLPLERPAHVPVELTRAAGALTIRFAGGPLALYAVGRALRADIPAVFYLLSAMPCAFHLIVLARVYELRPALMRLLVVGSTLPAVAAVVLAYGAL
jgi:predicted permease